MQDEQLIRLIQQGDDDAFRQLYEKYVHEVFRYIYIQIGDYQRAEELTQDVFVRVARGILRFRGDARFQTWLYTIVRNRLTDEIRTLPRQRKVIPHGQEELEALHQGYTTVEEHVLMGEREREFLDCLRQLSDDYRYVILLVDMEGMSLREAAKVLNRSEKATKSLHFRAIQKLRKLVEGGINVGYQG